MKTAFTRTKWSILLAFLCSMTFSYQSSAQRDQSKCPGFTAKITNGSVLNLCTGASITLNATPTTSGYSFKWQQQTTAGGPFMDIAGAAGVNYTTSSLGAYRVIVNTGSCIDTSGITNLIRIVVQGGTITKVNTNALCQGEAGGKINGSDVPGSDLGIVTYSWEMNEDNTGWVAIPGVTAPDYNVGNLSKTTAYRRVAKDNCGNMAYSNVVTYTLATAINGGVIAPASQTINRGQTPAPLTSSSAASGGGGTITYQWQQSFWDMPASNFKDIPGATSATYSPGALQETMYYRRVAKDSRCGAIGYSNLAVVNVTNQILNAGSFIITSTCFFPGQPPGRLQLDNPPRGGVGPYSLQWQSSTDNVNFTDIAGATSTGYQPGILNQTTYFRLKVTDATNTVAYTETAAIVMVTTTLTGGTIKSMAPYACIGSSPAKIESTGSATGFVGLSYQYQYKNNSTNNQWVDIQGADREAVFPPAINEKTTYRRVAIDRCGSIVRYANSNEITVDTRPAIFAGDIEPTSQMVRVNQTPKPLNNVTSPSGGTGSFSISWEAAKLAVGPWTTVTSADALSYQPGPVSQTTYYRRAVMDSGCLATKYTYAVEVYLNTAPPLTGGELGGSSCVFAGNTPTVLTTGANGPANGTPPFTYQWETRTGTTGTWSVITGATSESYQPTAITQTTQYRRKVTDSWGDTAYSTPFTINYVSTPLNPGSIKSNSIAICTGVTPGLLAEVTPATGGGAFAGYQWQMKTVGGSYSDIPGATGANYQPGAINQVTYFRRVAKEICGGVTHIAYSNEVYIDIAVITNFHAGLVNGPFIACAGSTPGTISSVLAACAGNTTIKYQWEVMQGGSWVNIAGATSASYTPGVITTDMMYRRKAYNDCGNSGYSNEVKIYVYPPIEAGSIGMANQSVCNNGTPTMIKLVANCHYTNGSVSYQWQSATSANGPWTDITGATGNQYQPGAATSNMYYRLKVMSTRCAAVAYTNTASVIVDMGCRTGRTIATNEMKVFPNPLTGNTIDVRLETKGKVSISLISSEGGSIPVSLSNTGAGQMRVSSQKNLTPGMYLLTVKDEKGNHTQKIVVQ